VEAFLPVGAARQASHQWEQRDSSLSRQAEWRHPLSFLATVDGDTHFLPVLLARFM